MPFFNDGPMLPGIQPKSDPLITSVYNRYQGEFGNEPPPPAGFFLILDNTPFLLLDGEFMTLL